MKIAMLGASAIAEKILPVLIGNSKFTVSGVYSQNRDRGEGFSARTGLPFSGNYNDCLSDPAIAAVYISVSNNMHFELVSRALEAKKHVLCEKPLVLSSSEARGLFSLAKENDLILLEGLMYRNHPQIRRMIEAVNSKTFGRAIRFSGSFCFDYEQNESLERRYKNGGGPIPDLCCYLIDFVNLLNEGSDLISIQRIDDELVSRFILNFKNGFQAILNCSMRVTSLNPWEVIFERGAVMAHRYNPHDYVSTDLYLINDQNEIDRQVIPAEGSGLSQFLEEFENFVDSIYKKSEPFVKPSESIRNATLVDKLLLRL